MRLNFGVVVVSVAGVLAAGGVRAVAQGSGEGSGRPPHIDECSVQTTRTYYLANATQPNDGNEIQTAMRNLLSQAANSKIYFVTGQNAIMVCALPDQQALAEKIIRDMDKPKKMFRLTFTITELDGGKRVGTQHYNVVATNGQRTTVKQGSKVPIATGSMATGGTAQTQFQYLDVGMSFDVTLTEVAGGAVVKAKVEQSSLAEPQTIAGVQEPVVRQLSFEGTPTVVIGKPAILSSLDVPNTTRHMDVDVMVEEVK